jgi:hypothetical protein
MERIPKSDTGFSSARVCISQNQATSTEPDTGSRCMKPQLRHTVPNSSPRHLHPHCPSFMSSLRIPRPHSYSSPPPLPHLPYRGAPPPPPPMVGSNSPSLSSATGRARGEAAVGTTVWKKPSPEVRHRPQPILVCRSKLVRHHCSKLVRHHRSASACGEEVGPFSQSSSARRMGSACAAPFVGRIGGLAENGWPEWVIRWRRFG